MLERMTTSTSLALAGIGMWVTCASGCHRHATPYDLAATAVGDPVFFEREQTARWLLVYDTLNLMAAEASGAVGSADDPMVCYVSGEQWQCVAGEFQPTGRFVPAQTWLMSGEGAKPVKADHGLGLAALALAVHLTQKDLGEDWALYPRVHGDAVEVWALPAWRPELGPVLGEIRRYAYEPDGGTLLSEQSWGHGSQQLDRNAELDLTLDSEQSDHPTVGELFFAMYHRDSFQSITIETRHYRVSLSDVQGTLGWARAAR
jgi:hypothetical protein